MKITCTCHMCGGSWYSSLSLSSIRLCRNSLFSKVFLSFVRVALIPDYALLAYITSSFIWADHCDVCPNNASLPFCHSMMHISTLIHNYGCCLLHSHAMRTPAYQSSSILDTYFPRQIPFTRNINNNDEQNVYCKSGLGMDILVSGLTLKLPSPRLEVSISMDQYAHP